MNKRKIKEAYEKATPIKDFNSVKENFDLVDKNSEFEDSKRHERIKKNFKWGSFAIVCATLCMALVPIIYVLSLGITTYEDYKVTQHIFSAKELTQIDTHGVNKLNDVIYPSGRAREEIEEKYLFDVTNFTYNIFENARVDKRNFSYAPLSLYQHMDILSTLAGEKYAPIFDKLLGQTNSARLKDHRAAFLNNHFENSKESVYMFNGLFLDDSLLLKEQKIDELTRRFTEIYSLDLQNEEHIDEMITWINDRLFTTFVDKEDLEIDELTQFILNSTFYFKEEWLTPYDELETAKQYFIDRDGKWVETDFMHHIVLCDIYNYDKYLSFYDQYHDYTVQYITPKDSNDDIFELLKGVNYLIEDESKKIYEPVDLTMPKFETTSEFNAKDALVSLGYDEIYDENNEVFNDSFTNSTNPLYLKTTKQKNRVSFNETGTKVESLTFSLSVGSAEPLPTKGYKVILDTPFIYVIRDVRGLPIYIGEYSYVK